MSSSGSESTPSLDELLRHAEAVRRMLHVVFDPAVGTEDLAQESFLRAWKKSGDPRSAHVAWWRAIAKNFALDVRRRSERRERRERACARNEAQPSAEDIVARTEAHRRVLERVLALDEPYRRVVLLRFFDGLEPREIAEATGQPEGTIRAQLHRALHLLRARFERDASLRSDAALLLGLPLAPPLSSLAITGGTLAMSTATKGLIAAALIAVCTWWAWPARETRMSRELEEPRDVVASSAPAEGAAEQVERTAASAEVPAALESVAAPSDLGLLLHGRLVSARGESFWHGHRGGVFFEDAQGERVWRGVDARGAFALFDLAPGDYEIEVVADQHRTLRTRFALAPTPPVQQLLLDLEKVPSIPVVVLDPSGLPLRESSFIRSGRFMQLGFFVSQEPLSAALPPITHSRYETSAGGLFRSTGAATGSVGWLDIHDSFPVHVAMLAGHAVLAQQVLDAAPEQLVFKLEDAALDAAHAKLRMRLVSAADAAPLPQVRYNIGHRQGATGNTLALADGILALDHLEAGRKGLLLAVPGYEIYCRAIDLEPGVELDLGELTLAPARSVRGRLIDERGEPRAAKLTLVDREGFSSRANQVELAGQNFRAVRGEFLLEGLGPRRYAVRAEIEHYGSACFELDLRAGIPGALEWRVPAGRPVSIRVAAPNGARWNLVVIDEPGGPVASEERSGTTTLQLHLAPGKYLLHLHCEGEELRAFPLNVWDGENQTVRIP